MQATHACTLVPPGSFVASQPENTGQRMRGGCLSAAHPARFLHNHAGRLVHRAPLALRRSGPSGTYSAGLRGFAAQPRRQVSTAVVPASSPTQCPAERIDAAGAASLHDPPAGYYGGPRAARQLSARWNYKPPRSRFLPHHAQQASYSESRAERANAFPPDWHVSAAVAASCNDHASRLLQPVPGEHAN